MPPVEYAWKIAFPAHAVIGAVFAGLPRQFIACDLA
jgi:hypothetical protein